MKPPTAHPHSIDLRQLPAAWRDLGYRLALACWLSSLICFQIGFVLWLNMSSELVALAMRCCSLIAIGLAGAGAVFALVFLVMRWGRSRRRFREAVLPALVIAGLMAFNFILFGVQLMIGSSIEISRHQSV